jgi:hypothetical protein|tara:strand:+ start:18 stop:188 length:171 start_codon:yes stop_codon:yes gene_type:complete
MSVATRAIRKVKNKLKKYREAEDAFIFHTGNNNPNHFVNPPKMSLKQAEKILSAKK